MREEGEIIYLSLHCHHQNDSCIKMGIDESLFNVSLTVRDKVARQSPQTTTFEEKGEPKRIQTQSHKTVSVDHNFGRERRSEVDSNRGPSAYQPNALPLGQTGSPRHR